MRKNIDIPNEIAEKLEKKASNENRNLKNYIENLLINDAKNTNKL